MKTLLLNLAMLILLVATSCKKKQESTPVTKQEIVEVLVKQDINVEYAPVYLSPNARPVVVAWKEYIDVQNKVYELKNTDTAKLEKQLNDLESLMTNLLNSKFPEKLKYNLSFEKKLDILEESIFKLKHFKKSKTLKLNDILVEIIKIMDSYKETKKQINVIYQS